MIESNEIQRHSVLQIKKFTVNSVNDSKILMVLDVEVIQSQVANKIGNPVEMKAGASSSSQATAAASPSHTPHLSSPIKPAGGSPTKPSWTGSPSSSPQKLRQPNFAPPSFDSQKPPELFAIPSLTPYQNRWSIKVRVANKTEIRHWDNAKGSGKLFSVDLIDDGGEIRATAFNELVDKFYDLLEPGKIFIVSRGSIRPAKKQFTSIKNDYELHFDPFTTVQLAEDQSLKIPDLYSFVAIPMLPARLSQRATLVDVIGIVKESSEAVLTKTKFQRDTMKRDLTLVDAGGNSIKLTIWGNTLDDLRAEEFPVLAVKGVRISDYGGCSLSTAQVSVLKLNPDIPEAHTLRGWYDTLGHETVFTTLSSTAGAAGGAAFDESIPRKMLKDADALAPGTSEEIRILKGMIHVIPYEKTFTYAACPDSGTKVVQDAQGWYSEKTGKHYPVCDYRYVLKFLALDASGQLWLSAFNDPGQVILKHPAAEVMQLKEEGQIDAFQGVFNAALFRSYVFKVKSKVESYQNEVYTRHQVLAAKPIDFVSDSKHLLAAIAELSR